MAAAGSTRAQAMLNLTAVALLVVIVVCFVFMPRYNYGHLLARIERMETQIARLESGLEKLNILAGDTESRRAAVIGQVNSIANKLNKLDPDLIAFLEHLTETSARVDGLAARFAILEGRFRPSEPSADERDNPRVAAGLAPTAYAGPAEEWLSADLDRAAEALSSRQLVEMTFEDFLQYLHRTNLPSFPERLEFDRVDAEKLGRLRLVFSSFRSCIQVLDQSERLLVDELVEKATKAGAYSEDDRDESPTRLQAQGGRETIHVKTLPDGRKWTFHLPIKEHSDFTRLDALRTRAMKSLLLSSRPRRSPAASRRSRPSVGGGDPFWSLFPLCFVSLSISRISRP